MNTGEADMDVIGERTEYVFGRSIEAGGAGNPALPTAIGVFHGIRASLAHAFGSDDLRNRTVVVQGAGGVGSALAEQLGNAGARVVVPDLDGDRATAVARRVNGTVEADPEAAELLRQRGILYAPDYVINVGGAITLAALEQLEWDRAELGGALARIGETLRQLYELAEAQGISTAAAAERLAKERLLAP